MITDMETGKLASEMGGSTRSKSWIRVVMARFLLCALSVSGVNAFSDEIKAFVGSYEEALKEAVTRKKPLLVDFYSDDSEACKAMMRSLQQIPDTIEKFIYYRVNLEKNDALARDLKVNRSPAVVIVSANGEVSDRWSGVFRDEKKLQLRLELAFVQADAERRRGESRDLPQSKSKPAKGTQEPVKTKTRSSEHQWFLEGVVLTSGKPGQAIINGKKVAVGDKVNGAVVQTIEQEEVKLIWQEKTLILTVGHVVTPQHAR